MSLEVHQNQEPLRGREWAHTQGQLPVYASCGIMQSLLLEGSGLCSYHLKNPNF